MNDVNRVVAIPYDNSLYPGTFREILDDDAPPVLYALGNLDLLGRQKLAFFCSRKCPGRLILRSIDLANELAETEVTVVGGFHTPVEREFLRVVLRGRASAVVCPARSLERMRVAAHLRSSFEDGRVLFISPFDGTVRRPTRESSELRNHVVVALADRVWMCHAEPSGMTERAVRLACVLGKTYLSVEDRTPLR